MKIFNVIWEINLTAATPLDAAKLAQEWLRDKGENWFFTVQDDETKKIYSVDLAEDDSVITSVKYTAYIMKKGIFTNTLMKIFMSKK